MRILQSLRGCRNLLPVWREELMSINYNEPITFGRRGSALALKCSGMDFSEDLGGSWTHAPTAELEIQIPIARHDVVLELEASPFLVPRILSVQKVFVILD